MILAVDIIKDNSEEFALLVKDILSLNITPVKQGENGVTYIDRNITEVYIKIKVSYEVILDPVKLFNIFSFPEIGELQCQYKTISGKVKDNSFRLFIIDSLVNGTIKVQSLTLCSLQGLENTSPVSLMGLPPSSAQSEK